MFLLAIEILKEKAWFMFALLHESQDRFQICFLLWEDGTFQWRCPWMESNRISYMSCMEPEPPGDSDSHRSLQSWCLHCLKCTWEVSLVAQHHHQDDATLVKRPRIPRFTLIFYCLREGGHPNVHFFWTITWLRRFACDHGRFLWYKWISRKEQFNYLWEFLGIDSQQSDSDIGNQWNFGGLNTRTKQ